MAPENNQFETSQSIKEIATALCKFQGEVQKIAKTETNPFFKSKYADLSSILDGIREPMFNNDLSVVQMPVGEHELCTMIMHTSGEWMRSTYKMTPTKNDPQGLGSVITYQRRYALGAILCLNIDSDDDGNAASTPQKNTDTKPWLNENTDAWTKVVKFIADGGKFEEVKKKYKISKTNEQKIIDQSIQN